MVSGIRISFIKHAILPIYSWLPAERTWTFASLELVTVMGILYEKLHVFTDMNVNDNWCMIFNVEQQILYVLFFVAEFVWSFMELFLTFRMIFHRFRLHVKDGILLDFWQSFYLLLLEEIVKVDISGNWYLLVFLIYKGSNINWLRTWLY